MLSTRYWVSSVQAQAFADLAESALRGALRQGLSARRRASVLTDLATIGLQRSDVDQLIGHAEAALEIATQTRSGFVSRKLQELQGHLAPLTCT